MSILDDLQKNRELFLQFNDVKYKRFQQLIPNPAIRKVVNAIPLLLSANYKRLPGYMEGDPPCGIVGFEPDEEALKFIQARFYAKEFEIRKKSPFIQMMAVMGSVGTIAYTRNSDYDYWVCVDRQSLPPERFEAFAKKVEAVQNWAMEEADIEVHIFINDITDIKNNIFAESEEEAFGSIIGTVLKDEFFRSSIIIAGKTPFWWVLPRLVRDSEYESLYAMVSPEVREKQYVDLGNLYEISKQDFIGPALFLIIKSLGNPFKSIIKLGLLEKYLFASDYTPLLCQKIKSNILRGNLDNKVIDSYIMMFEEVYDYYDSSMDEPALLKILRQNLYLKINPQLSRYIGVKDRQNLPYKVLVMFKYVKEWNWTAKDIQLLDNFENWDYNQTMVFWNLVKKFMLLSYQKIALQIPAMKLEDKISSSDFKLLSGKIKSHFAQESNKIDNYITFKDTPYESVLNVEPSPGGGDEGGGWSLIKKSKAGDDTTATAVLRSEKSLVRLIAWAAINQIYDPTFSRLKMQAGNKRMNQNAVLDLLTGISTLFSGTLSRLKNEHYMKPPFKMANMIILNFGMENAETVTTIHHIYQTSWGESYIDEYARADDLVSILGTVLKEGIQSRQKFDDYCVIVSPEPFKKPYKDIGLIFKEAFEFISGKDRRIAYRFCARLGGMYVTATRDVDTVTISSDGDIVKALMRLSLNPRQNVAYGFHTADPRLMILDAMYNMRKKNSITVLYEESGEHVLIYVINERDNLFTFIRPKRTRDEMIIYLYDFCQNILGRISGHEGLPLVNQGIQLHQIAIDRSGKLTFENKNRWIQELFLVKFKTRKPLAVRVARSGSGEARYAVAAQGEASEALVPLNQLPGLVERIMRTHPSCIAAVHDMVFADMQEKELSLGSTPYLMEKYKIELMIGKAVK
ncbi:MAG: class I adenylate cyclase [Spirochaetes bacterium]|nr:class I adenylate cyclase [Spirochaetota bacterium]